MFQPLSVSKAPVLWWRIQSYEYNRISFDDSVCCKTLGLQCWPSIIIVWDKRYRCGRYRILNWIWNDAGSSLWKFLCRINSWCQWVFVVCLISSKSLLSSGKEKRNIWWFKLSGYLEPGSHRLFAHVSQLFV